MPNYLLLSRLVVIRELLANFNVYNPKNLHSVAGGLFTADSFFLFLSFLISLYMSMMLGSIRLPMVLGLQLSTATLCTFQRQRSDIRDSSDEVMPMKTSENKITIVFITDVKKSFIVDSRPFLPHLTNFTVLSPLAFCLLKIILFDS